MKFAPARHTSVNPATRTGVAALGVVFAISILAHGGFEVWQGYTPTPGCLIEAIGPAHRFWVGGSEPAFTLIPNFFLTGLAAILTGLAIIGWSVWGLHRPEGPTVWLALFVLSTLTGGGIGQVLFFPVGWVFATRIRRPLLPGNGRSRLARWWRPLLTLSAGLILFALEIAVFGWVPGVNHPDKVTGVMLAVLGAGYAAMLLAFAAGIARDREKGGLH